MGNDIYPTLSSEIGIVSGGVGMCQLQTDYSLFQPAQIIKNAVSQYRDLNGSGRVENEDGAKRYQFVRNLRFSSEIKEAHP